MVGWLAVLLTGCGDPGLEPWNVTEESARLTVTPEGDVSFGEIPAGTSTVRLLALRADEGADAEASAEVTDIYFSEDTDPAFVLEAVTLPLVVEAVDIVSVEISFAPGEAGTFSGTVFVSDGGERPLERRLIGFACTKVPGSSGCD